jgi:large subunit ribosomal protein L19
MNITQLIEVKANPTIPTLAPGDTVKVSIKVIEGDKERIQAFQGVVMKIRQGTDGGSFMVRRPSFITCEGAAARRPASRKSG